MKQYTYFQKNQCQAIIDIDGILANFEDYWLKYVNEELGHYWEPDPRLYGWEEQLQSTYGPKGTRIVSKFYENGLLRKLSPINGSIEFVETIKNLGFKINVLTGRPTWDHPNVFGDTAHFLAKNGYKFDTLGFCKDKADYCRKILFADDYPTYSFAIDDSYHYATNLLGTVNDIFLRNRPHNAISGRHTLQHEESLIRFDKYEYFSVAEHVLDSLTFFVTSDSLNKQYANEKVH